MKKEDFILFSGGAAGSEEAFGVNAEKFGIEEINYTFEGHEIKRTRGIRILNHEELLQGDVSLTYVSKIMSREYPRTKVFRRILQSIWYQINSSQEIFVIGNIMEDKTVRGGTGWGAEFAKICNKDLFVFDQTTEQWHKWGKDHWEQIEAPKITKQHFSGTGTRQLSDSGKKAIDDLFTRSFGELE